MRGFLLPIEEMQTLRRIIAPTVAGFVLLALLVFWGMWWLAAPGYLEGNYAKASAAGEMFGALNTLFTAFAFSGLVFTIFLQFQQLETSREDLQTAREQLDDARRTGEQERFENTFFQLLSLFTGSIDSLQLHSPSTHLSSNSRVTGREALHALCIRLEGALSDGSWTHWQMVTASQNRRAFLTHAYREWYNDNGYLVAHYFRVLYRLIRHVEMGKVGDTHLYAKIVRAQISGPELKLLFYNSFISEGAKMHRLIEKYALLKHLSDEYLSLATDRDFYNPSAYSNDLAGPPR